MEALSFSVTIIATENAVESLHSLQLGIEGIFKA